MKKLWQKKYSNLLLVILSAFLLSACGNIVKFAKVDVPSNIAKGNVLKIKTSGEFWGFGKEGTFSVADNYTGSFNRDASGFSIISTIKSDSTSLFASLVNKKTNKSYSTTCSGSNFEIGPLSLGGDADFECKITSGNKNVGSFVLNKPRSIVGSLISSNKVSGFIKVGSISYKIESVHKSKDLLIPSEYPLGYIIKKGGKTVGIVQTQGVLSLQHIPLVDESNIDALVLSAVIGGLRIPIQD